MVFIIGGAFQGKTNFANAFNGKKLLNLHAVIREHMNKNEEILINFNEYDVITCDEISSGLIPIDKFEVDYRERVGRISCEVASKSETVYRVFAGIPIKIKG